jgi:glycosyltransferase involved in cell wall biosynthesis
MLAVIVPAHNEERELEACLQSVRRALRWPALQGEATLCVVALDDCSDASAAIVRRAGCASVTLSLRNVGAARAAGAALALAAGARWLAFTDADSQVAPSWLQAQLALASDAVCGTVAVADWGDYGETMHLHHQATYTDADGHHHIHGANLGVSAAAYCLAGGFQPLASSEDVALVRALQASGARIAWSAAPRVVTSARRNFRAPGGFGATLQRVYAASRSRAQVAAAA